MSAPEVRLIPLADVHPWPGNPRKSPSAAGLEELAASIKAVGVLQPIVVRPVPERSTVKANAAGTRQTRITTPAGYEIAAGHRRRAAAELAGLAAIPATVRDLTDKEMLEIAAVENEQREDTTVLERAETYRRLIDEHGHTRQTIAAKIGKSEATVRDLLRLTQLPPAAAKALATGEITPKVAGLIARIPGAETRAAAADYILKGEERWQDGRKVRVVYSSRAVQEIIRRDYTRELKGAPFNRKALDLVPAAGSCDACPKRVGNLQKDDPEGYEGQRADVCTDPACYRAKALAAQARTAAAAQADGLRVLPAAECAELYSEWDGGRLGYDAPYFDLAEPCLEDTKRRSYKQLVGEDLAAETVLAFDHDGHAHRLVPKEKALPILQKKHGLLKGERATGSARSPLSAHEKKRRTEEKARRALNRRLVERVVEAAAALYAKLAAKALEPLLRVLTPAIAAELWDNTLGEILKRRGLAAAHYGARKEAMRKLCKDLDGAGLLGLLAECAIAKSLLLPNSFAADESGPILQALGIDRKAVARELKAAGNGKASATPTAAWRSCLVSDPAELTASPQTLAQLEREGILTLGQLDDALYDGYTLGLSRLVIAKLREQLDRHNAAPANGKAKQTAAAHTR